MFAEVVAIFSAMGWAGDSVLVRLGLRQSNIFAAMLVSYTVSVTCIWTYLLITTPLDFLSSPAMLYFLISGCLQPLFARALYYEALTRIGVSRAGPLRAAEPFFATAIAVSILHEQPTVPVYVGTVLIVASVWAFSAGRAEPPTGGCLTFCFRWVQPSFLPFPRPYASKGSIFYPTHLWPQSRSHP